MADACCSPPPLNLDRHRDNKAYRRVLWAVLAINAVMFLAEIGAVVVAQQSTAELRARTA
jgi:Co/Zn/Cd efflux system component